MADNSGAKVSLGGIEPAVTVETDKDGHWIMKDVPSGTYTITYSKDGFDGYKQFNVQHVGGSVSTFPYVDDRKHLPAEFPEFYYNDDKLSLYKLIPFKPLTFQRQNSNNGFSATGTSSNELPYKSFIAFFNTKGEATASNYNYLVTATTSYNGTNFGIFGNYELLRTRYGYKTGDIVSVKVYGFASLYNSADVTRFSYFDPSIGRRVYTNISKEGFELKFTMP